MENYEESRNLKTVKCEYDHQFSEKEIFLLFGKENSKEILTSIRIASKREQTQIAPEKHKMSKCKTEEDKCLFCFKSSFQFAICECNHFICNNCVEACVKNKNKCITVSSSKQEPLVTCNICKKGTKVGITTCIKYQIPLCLTVATK